MQEQVMGCAKRMYDILDAKKLESIEVLDVHELTTLADIFIIAVSNNTRATKALADELDFRMVQTYDMEPYRKEGYDTGTWILMDYGDVIVHILCEEDASFYGLDHLWQDATTLIF